MTTSASVIFGQLVIGAPGAGKTTYCEAMSRFLKGYFFKMIAKYHHNCSNKQITKAQM